MFEYTLPSFVSFTTVQLSFSGPAIEHIHFLEDLNSFRMFEYNF